MADRPFRGARYGGIAPLGEGIEQGVNSFVQNYLAMKRQQTTDKYADIAGRREAMIEGQLQGQTAPLGQGGQPAVDTGGGGAAVLATSAPGREDVPPSARYIETQAGVPLPEGDSSGHPYFTQDPNAQPGVGQFPGTATVPGRGTALFGTSPELPPGSKSVFSHNYPMQADPTVQPPPEGVMPMARPSTMPKPTLVAAQAGPVGAQAMAADKPVEEMSLDELREMSLQHSKQAREAALANETDLDMLQGAYHYNQLMSTAKPYIDQWAKALNEVKANPQNPEKWRGVQVLSGEEDPQKALAIATKEYSALRGQYEEYNKNYGPLNERLTKRGITPDQYANEAQFLEFRNKKKSSPHNPSSSRGAGTIKTPKTRRSYEHGTDYVPETGAAVLHQGEMVLPKTYAEVVRRATPPQPDVQGQGEQTAAMLGGLIQRFVGTGDKQPPVKKKTRAEQVADFYAGYIDRPNDPKARGSVRTQEYFDKFDAITDPKRTGYIPNDLGYLQQNPQYRGIRMVLPQSGGSYSGVQGHFGREAMKSGTPRIETEGPVAPPDPRDPHNNPFPRVPVTHPLDMGRLREEVYGHLISRGYPVYGGTGDFGGEFPPGFNPVGFGQREQPVGAAALATTTSRATRGRHLTATR